MEQGDETQVVVTGSTLFSLFTDQIRNEEVEAALQLIQLSGNHEECTSNTFCYEEAADDYGFLRKKIKKEEKDRKNDHDHDQGQGQGGLGENVVGIRRDGIVVVDNEAVKPSSSLLSSSSTSESTRSSVISQVSLMARLEKEVVIRRSPKRKQLRVRSIDDLYGITKPL